MLSLLFALCLLTATAVPRFEIDLDAPEEDRWIPVVEHYREELPSMMKAWGDALVDNLGKEQMEAWLSAIKLDPGYMRELQGIVKAANHADVTLDLLTLWQYIYELHNQTFCSGFLVAMPNGTVIHGRNMDYTFPFYVNGEMRNWPSVTYDAEYVKDGKPLFVTTGWPGHIGTSTAMRYDGWTFEQNTRSRENNQPANLASVKEHGGWSHTLGARRIMEMVPDFETAVQQIYDWQFAAPQIFIVSGAEPWQGAVITVDRNGKGHNPVPPTVERLDEKAGVWHLMQANYDRNKFQDDPRKPIANYLLSSTTQDDVSEEFVWQQLRTFPVFNPMTVFSDVFVAALNKQETRLPTGAEAMASIPLLLEVGMRTKAAQQAFVIPHNRSQSLVKPHMMRGAAKFSHR